METMADSENLVENLFEAALELARAGSFGYTVRVVPKHANLASAAELGLIAVAH